MGCEASHEAGLSCVIPGSTNANGLKSAVQPLANSVSKNGEGDGGAKNGRSDRGKGSCPVSVFTSNWPDLGFGRRPGDTSPPALNDQQRRMIKQTWAVIEPNVTYVGKQVFLRIFKYRPSVKQMYTFRDIHGDRLTSHPMFRLQCDRFMTTVTLVVRSVDTLSSEPCGCPALFELGRKHVSMSGFMPNYFDAFLRAITAVWAEEIGETNTPEAADAWKTLFTYAIDQLKNGYEEELQSRKGTAG